MSEPLPCARTYDAPGGRVGRCLGRRVELLDDDGETVVGYRCRRCRAETEVTDADRANDELEETPAATTCACGAALRPGAIDRCEACEVEGRALPFGCLGRTGT